MNTLFQYRATALMSAAEDNYIRLEIHASKSREHHLDKVHCSQIKAWLPIGKTVRSISDTHPVSFSSIARWAHSDGSTVTESDVVAGGSAEQPMKTYVFDDEARGVIPFTEDHFTIGFRIEKPRLQALEKLVIHLEEMSGTGENPVARRAAVAVSLELIQPSIFYFIATRVNNAEPCTVFARNEPIQLQWAGNMVQSYQIFAGPHKINIDNGSTTHVLQPGMITRDTPIILKGIGKLGSEQLETYHALTLGISDQEYTGMRLTGDLRMHRQHQAGDPATWQQAILFTDEADRAGARITAHREGWEGAPMGLAFQTGALNNVTDRIVIKSNGNVTLGPVNTASPARNHAMFTVYRGYSAHEEVNPIMAIDTGNTAQGFLWGNSPVGPYDTSHWSFNYYRNEKQDVIPNTGYGTTQISQNNQGYIAFSTGIINQAPTEKVRIDAAGGVGIGTTEVNSNLKLQVKGGGGVWKGGIASGDTKSVIMGELLGVACIGGHKDNLNDWDTLAINPGGGKVGVGTMGVHENFTMQVKGNNGAWKGGIAAGNEHAAVVMGELSGVASIGGHNGALDAWSNLAINADGGNVGIGTYKPYSKLSFGGSPTARKIALFENKDGANAYGLYFHPEPFRTSVLANGGEVISATWDGNVGIGTTAPQQKLHVEGDTLLNGKVWVRMHDNGGNPMGHINQLGYWADFAGNNGRFTLGPAYSDQRLKQDVKPINEALSRLMQLQSVTFRWSEEGLQEKTKRVEQTYRSESGTEEDNQRMWEVQKQRIREENSGTYRGFIAQEVEEVFPEWVKTDESGYKTLDTSELLPLLVESVKEQQQQIEALIREIQALKEVIPNAVGS